MNGVFEFGALPRLPRGFQAFFWCGGMRVNITNLFTLISLSTNLCVFGIKFREILDLEWLPIELIDSLAEQTIALLSNFTARFIGILSHPSEI
jgi:hypothetical protein